MTLRELLGRAWTFFFHHLRPHPKPKIATGRLFPRQAWWWLWCSDCCWQQGPHLKLSKQIAKSKKNAEAAGRLGIFAASSPMSLYPIHLGISVCQVLWCFIFSPESKLQRTTTPNFLSGKQPCQASGSCPWNPVGCDKPQKHHQASPKTPNNPQTKTTKNTSVLLHLALKKHLSPFKPIWKMSKNHLKPATSPQNQLGAAKRFGPWSEPLAPPSPESSTWPPARCPDGFRMKSWWLGGGRRILFSLVFFDLFFFFLGGRMCLSVIYIYIDLG